MLPSSFGVKALGKTPFSRYRRSFGITAFSPARPVARDCERLRVRELGHRPSPIPLGVIALDPVRENSKSSKLFSMIVEAADRDAVTVGWARS